MINGNEMLELIKARQSDRKYESLPVETGKLGRILEAGRLAPSACNAQPWKLILVTDADLLGKLAEAASARLLGMNGFVSQAPAMIVIVREKANFSSKIGATIKSKDYSLIDIGIASENMCLQAAAEGIGSCMLGWFDEPEVRKILSIPRAKRVELIITFGYSAAEKREKRRKPHSEVISYNKY
jgi:nitroreductase